MVRRSTHPDLTVEYLLQELEQQGVDATLIAAFACRAASRRSKHASVSRPSHTGSAAARGEAWVPGEAGQVESHRKLQTV